MVDVTVVTPSLPSRAGLLAEACASVAGQDALPAAHLIGVDHAGRGPAEIRSELVAAAHTKWVAFLDDDDLLDPCHLALLHRVGEQADADVVIPYCRFDGDPLPARYCNQAYDRQALRERGIFPITVLVKTATVRRCGLFRPEDRYEDWALWNRVADWGGFFLVVPEVTWTYRTAGADRRTNGVNV